MTQDSAASPTNRRELVISFALMLVFDIGLNILLFQTLRAHGASELVAYLVASLGPLVSMAVELARHRRLSRFSLFIVAVNVLSALVSVIGDTDGRWLILKDSVFTGGIGLVFLGSLLAARPLLFWFGQKFATDGTDAGVAQWDSLWQYPSFRRSQRVITAVWGLAFVLEAAARVVAALTLDFDRAYTFGQVLPLVVVALCTTFTVVYGRRVRRAGEARASAAAA